MIVSYPPSITGFVSIEGVVLDGGSGISSINIQTTSPQSATSRPRPVARKDIVLNKRIAIVNVKTATILRRSVVHQQVAIDGGIPRTRVDRPPVSGQAMSEQEALDCRRDPVSNQDQTTLILRIQNSMYGWVSLIEVSQPSPLQGEIPIQVEIMHQTSTTDLDHIGWTCTRIDGYLDVRTHRGVIELHRTPGNPGLDPVIGLQTR